MKTIELKDLNSILGEKVGKIRYGELVIEEYGNIYLQIYKGNMEGVACYGIIGREDMEEELFIDLSKPIWIDFKRFMTINKETKKVELGEY